MLDRIAHEWQSLAAIVGTIAGALLLGLAIHVVVFKIAKRLAQKNQKILNNALVRHCRNPSRLILPILMAYLSLPLVDVAPKYAAVFERSFGLVLILSVAWLIVKLTYVFEDILLSRFNIGSGDHLKTRKITTQIQVLRKVVAAVVIVIALALILMSFQSVRHLGTSLLASAGIIGIVIGVAAQRSIGSLIAGLQIAITESIRIDDTVVVEHAFGSIEEINLTYVVVRLWDSRRLILPITYFLEKPFENWTRRSVDLLGTVIIYADYGVPVADVREELHRILEHSKLWDKRAWGLQVTNATERALELRALMSAADASSTWDLRCEVREKLIEFIRKTYPDSLPRVRAEVSGIGQSIHQPGAQDGDKKDEPSREQA